MQLEKWQALGNDYLIVEADALPFALTPARVRRLCDGHLGVGADGVLLLARSADPQYVAELRIFNPDGSEAELSGNGAREAIMYLRRAGWTEQDEFAIHTAAGPIRPTITGDTTCRVDMGRAAVTSSDYPTGGPDGRGIVRGGGREFAFQHVSIGNPQCAIALEDLDELEGLALIDYGPEIEHSDLFPRRTNVSWFVALDDHTVRARIFERGVGETLSSGHRRERCGRRPRAPRRSLSGHRASRRRRARRRARRRPEPDPHRLGRARVPGDAQPRLPRGAACNRVSAWSASRRTCSPNWKGRSPPSAPPAST